MSFLLSNNLPGLDMMERVAEILSPSNLDMMSLIGSCLVYRRRTKEMFIHLPSFSQTSVCFASDRDSSHCSGYA
jgi:hypothetical protein